MILVVEGVDHAGKTTLAHAVMNEFVHGPVLGGFLGKEVSRLHKGPPDESRHILQEYEGDLLHYPAHELTSLRHLYVLDRWHLGEALYGPLLRGGSRLTKAQLLHVELLLASLGAVKVVVTSDAESLMQRHMASPDGVITLSQAHFLQLDYLHLIRELSDWDIIDSSTGTDPDARALLIQMVIRTSMVMHLPCYSSYIGPVQPAALLVGDCPGGSPPEWARAFEPMKPGCSSHLISSLHNEGVLSRTGFVNQEGTDLTGLWYALGAPNVIALGQVAAAAIGQSGIRPSQRFQVHHPQYVRRFETRTWDNYVHNIKELVNG